MYSILYLAGFLSVLSGVTALPDQSSQQLDPAIKQALGGAQNPPLNNSAFTCKALKLALGDNTTATSADPGYTALVDLNYSETCWLDAQCIVSPNSTAQVSRAITIVNSLNTTFAVRSGGHQQAVGVSGVGQEGVLISLQKFTQIQLSADKKTANIGPGNRWGTVYSTLGENNLTVIGGRVGIVGVGGLLLGGGVNYLRGQYGLGVDNIASYEVVLSSGKVVTASPTQNDDLYQALRGGGANFGIVTNFEMVTHPLGDIYYEVLFFPPSQNEQVLRALAEYQNTGGLDPLADTSFGITQQGSTTLLLYAKPVAARPAVFNAFYKVFDQANGTFQVLPPQNSTLSALATFAIQAFPENQRVFGETFSNTVDADYMVEAFQIFQNLTSHLPSSVETHWVPAPIPKSAITYGKGVNGGNILGLQEEAQQWHEWYIQWTDASLDDQIFALSNTITAQVTAAAKKRNAFIDYLFMNTAGLNQQVLQSYGSSNVQKIKAAAAKYDTAKTFQRLQSKGWLVRDL